ncbi:MAG: GntR family transcriptional regulator [Kiritimatiellae bacterium]|nr:GntR family transcriptional regulator [Kiritimatiellia bacterium]
MTTAKATSHLAPGPQEPLYRALADALRKDIASAGSEPKRLPTGRELCEPHGVSLITVRKAMALLAAEGLITRTPKRGTFVVPPTKQTRRDLTGLAVAMNITAAPGDGSFMSLQMLGANDFLQRHNVHVVIKESPKTTESAQIFTNALARSGVAGFLCYSYNKACVRAMVQAALSAAFPIVVLSDREDELPVDYVTCDNHAGGLMAAEYLLSLGHRHIAFLAQKDHATQMERWEMLRQRVSQAGGEAALYEVWRSNDEMERFLAERSRFTAAFCGHDHGASRLIQQLAKRGLRVPDDFSVIGYDNSVDVCEHAAVPITTVAQPAREMGLRAAQLVYERMSGQIVAGPRRLQLAPELIVRASAAPPRELSVEHRDKGQTVKERRKQQ